MQSELEEILSYQLYWSSENTEEMQLRGSLVRDKLPSWMQSLARDLMVRLPEHFQDLRSSGKDATGRKSEIPWARTFSVARSPRATGGWYLVYLFDALGSTVYLSLNQGTTKWTGSEFRPRPASETMRRSDWARDKLSGDSAPRADLVTAISLNARRSDLGPAYESGNVFALAYSVGAIPDDETLASDFIYMLGKLVEVYELDENDLAVPGDPAAEVIDALLLAEEASGSRRPRARRKMTAEERKAIEQCAVALATKSLESQGYRVRDVGATQSYDLDANRGSDRLYVEVKGTTSPGIEVVLTRNEVALHLEKHPMNMLAVVSGIHLDNSGLIPVARGGDLRLISPWLIEEASLAPLSYAYTIPPA
ncbi:MAG: MrcB family domain-containing protein [Microbacteriaceae bacterium]